MTADRERRVRSGQSLAIVDLVQSAFAAELLAPSRPLWIASPWISNLELLDNTGRQFSGIVASWPPRPIRLVEVMTALLQRGGEIVVVTRDVDINQTFLQELDKMAGTDHGLTLILTDVIHEKGITGDSFTLDGSMNLTYTGLRIKEEYVVYATRPEVVAQRRLEFRTRWQDRM